MLKIKENHWLPKMLGVNAITLGRTILFSNEQNKVTLLHETAHVIDQCVCKDGKAEFSRVKSLWWYIRYTFPQNMAVFSILAFLNVWFLLFLLALLPIPYLNGFRLKCELKGYYWNHEKNWMWSDCPKDQCNKIFTSWLYFKMLWFDKPYAYYLFHFSEYEQTDNYQYVLKQFDSIK